MSIRFENYERLAGKIILKHCRLFRGELVDSDAYSLACLVFMQCVNRFRPKKGFKFSTFFGYTLRKNLCRLAKEAITRKERLRHIYGLDLDLYQSRNLGENIEAKDLAEYIMARVEPRHADTLVAIQAGSTLREEAERLGMTTQAVHLRRKAALRNARQVALEAL